MILADDNVAKNWQVTSDSLSAWLANKIGAEQLVLVKSKLLAPYLKSSDVSLETLVAEELIDDAFADFFSGTSYQSWIVNKSDYWLFEQGLNLRQLRANSIAVSKDIDGS
jgi:aspartokinase-like uncharacterized kinase